MIFSLLRKNRISKTDRVRVQRLKGPEVIRIQQGETINFSLRGVTLSKARRR